MSKKAVQPNNKPTKKELESIKLYRERVQELRDKALVTAGKTKVTVHLAGTVPKVLEGVDEDYLISFLATLRQFMLKKDPINFERINGLVHSNCGRPELQTWLAYTAKLWKQTMESSPIGISFDGHCPTVEEILSLFLYGGMIHSDLDKAEQLRRMPVQLQGLHKMMLISSLQALSHALVVTNRVILSVAS